MWPNMSVRYNLCNPLQLKEVFGAGTACVVCPVNRILYLDEVCCGTIQVIQPV